MKTATSVVAEVVGGPITGRELVVFPGPSFFWLAGDDDLLIANTASLHVNEIMDARCIYTLHDVRRRGEPTRYVLLHHRLPGKQEA